MTSADEMGPFAARVLLRYLDALEAHIEGARAMSDPESVHQLRVASRRLRAALSLFKKCFPRESVERDRRALQGLTRSLGAARDTDVQIAFLENLRSHPEARPMEPALRFLLRNRADHRRKLQEAVVENLGGLASAGPLGELRGMCRTHLTKPGGKRSFYRSLRLRRAAQGALKTRYAELMEFFPHVRRAEAAEEHHRLRIAAKRLRYTMEIFAPLHRGRLKTEIKAFKKLKDVLGELHDLDVWIAAVPGSIEAARRECGNDTILEESLAAFRDFVVRRRAELHAEFVRFWEEKQMRTVLDSVRDRSGDLLSLPAESFRRAAAIADVHANLPALEAVVREARRRKTDLFICAGDIVGIGAFPNKVVKKLKSEDVLSVIGNYDLEVLRAEKPGPSPAAFNPRRVSGASRTFLTSLPTRLTVKIGEKVFLIAHGSPRSVDEKLTDETEAALVEDFLRDASADVLISGHSHHPSVQRLANGLHLNPGSVGRPADGDPRASYALITLKPFGVKIFRVAYDLGAAAREMRKYASPEEIVQTVLAGLSLEKIREEDRRISLLTKEEKISKIRNASKAYLPGDVHSANVVALSMSLFDALVGLHGLGITERYHLACAAWLHDTGWSTSPDEHHKRSMEIVLNDRALPMTSEERKIVGSVVRYHNGLPDKGHSNLAGLEFYQRKTVFALAALLRIADSLDASHRGVVKSLEVKAGPRRVNLIGSHVGDIEEERGSLARKKDLFEKTFRRKCQVAWVPERLGRPDSPPPRR